MTKNNPSPKNSTWYWPDVNSCSRIHLNACFKIFIWKARLYRGYESLLNLKVVSAVFGVSYSWIPKWTFWIFATCFYTNKNTPRTNKNFNDHYITECICEYSIKILNNATFNCKCISSNPIFELLSKSFFVRFKSENSYIEKIDS